MFGIEFAPEVVQADGNVRNLAWRICNAKKVLVSVTREEGELLDLRKADKRIQAPYSMSPSHGRNTPTKG